MRHRVYGKHFGRNIDERKSLFKGLVHSLIISGTILTSETNAKAVKGLIDKVINLAKNKKAENRFQSFLTDKTLQERLIGEIIPKLGTRTSGYTRTVRIGPRLGDQTTMVKMSLIGTEDLKPFDKMSSVKRPESSKKEVKKDTVELKQKISKPVKKTRITKNAKKGVIKS